MIYTIKYGLVAICDMQNAYHCFLVLPCGWMYIIMIYKPLPS